MRYSLASILAGVLFLVGFALYGSSLIELTNNDTTVVEKLEFIRDNQSIYYLSNIILNVLFGLAQLATTASQAKGKDLFAPKPCA